MGFAWDLQIMYCISARFSRTYVLHSYLSPKRAGIYATLAFARHHGCHPALSILSLKGVP